PYGDARAAIDAGATVALASDYNPGSSPSGNMRFVASLGAVKMKLTPEQALNATTLNGAVAMGLDSGTLNRGKRADFILTEPMPSLTYLLYAYQTPLIRQVFLNGKAQ
ncbi:MAG: amidohydrolase family protein, partial [Muribaculaceae bacterium]|nr:amidohydrolase family protein [Muribaculaceae bacterium]